MDILPVSKKRIGTHLKLKGFLWRKVATGFCAIHQVGKLLVTCGNQQEFHDPRRNFVTGLSAHHFAVLIQLENQQEQADQYAKILIFSFFRRSPPRIVDWI